MIRKELLEPLREYAATLTAFTIDKRIEEGKAPLLAPLDEMLVQVQEDFKAVMREYVKDSTLICHKDLNGKAMFEFSKSK